VLHQMTSVSRAIIVCSIINVRYPVGCVNRWCMCVCYSRDVSAFPNPGKQVRQCRRFNGAGTQFTVRLKHPPDTEPNPVVYFLASVEELFEYALANVADEDMVGVSIRNVSSLVRVSDECKIQCKFRKCGRKEPVDSHRA
jgi:hypothetical protein